MEFILSRNLQKKLGYKDIESVYMYVLWKTPKRNIDGHQPYNELKKGETLYLYATNQKKIIWETKINKIEKGEYSSKNEIREKYPHNDNSTRKYLKRSSPKGYYLAFKLKVVKFVDIGKPMDYTFPRLGWDIFDKKWELSKSRSLENTIENNITIDKLIGHSKKKSIIDKLQEANRKMQKWSPAKVNKIVETTITVRNDTPLVKALKNAANYKCQFNGCTAQIKMESGKYYVEVAHIKAVKDGGTSVLGNLLVLCPNHHKEFDHGKRDIEIQEINRLVGKLNGVPFDIKLYANTR